MTSLGEEELTRRVKLQAPINTTRVHLAVTHIQAVYSQGTASETLNPCQKEQVPRRRSVRRTKMGNSKRAAVIATKLPVKALGASKRTTFLMQTP